MCTCIVLLAIMVTNVNVPGGSVFSQDFRLPAPGVMVQLSPEFNPPILQGIKVHPDNPFRFEFILDKGDSKLGNDLLKDESSRLIKYFMASLTIPEKDLWVNLSPYEKDRVVPESFGRTEMGRDLLAEDYMLKQITASLIYPEGEIGKKFWKRIYTEAAKRYGSTNIPVNTFNKVWILPAKAVVYENAQAGTAYVVESKLKVMLEQDYLSLTKHAGIQSTQAQAKNTSQLGSQIAREIVIPELTKEVNEGKNFAQLRQVYNSLILATWYKKKIKYSILSEVYEDRNKIAGVNIFDPREKQRIYERYLKAFKKGVFNYIQEDQDILTHQDIPRKYFSGGVTYIGLGNDLAMASSPGHLLDAAMRVDVTIDPEFSSLVPPMVRISELMKTGSIETLIRILQNTNLNDFYRVSVLKALGRIGDARAVDPLIKVIETTRNSDVRAIAADALGRIGDARAVDPLIKVIETTSNSDYVRAIAADALVRIGDARAVDPLIKVIETTSNSDYVRARAADALVRIGDARAVDPLIKVIETTRNSDVRARAADALEKITAKSKEGVERMVEKLVAKIEQNPTLLNSWDEEISAIYYPYIRGEIRRRFNLDEQHMQGAIAIGSEIELANQESKEVRFLTTDVKKLKEFLIWLVDENPLLFYRSYSNIHINIGMREKISQRKEQLIKEISHLMLYVYNVPARNEKHQRDQKYFIKTENIAGEGYVARFHIGEGAIGFDWDPKEGTQERPMDINYLIDMMVVLNKFLQEDVNEEKLVKIRDDLNQIYQQGGLLTSDLDVPNDVAWEDNNLKEIEGNSTYAEYYENARVHIRKAIGDYFSGVKKAFASDERLAVKENAQDNPEDNAMSSLKGGIDLTSDKALIVKNNGEAIKFNIDPAMMKRLKNATGFSPSGIIFQPMNRIMVKEFLDQK